MCERNKVTIISSNCGIEGFCIGSGLFSSTRTL